MADAKPIKKFLLIPGPTPIPEEVKQAMAADMIGHRSADFKTIYAEVSDGLKWAFQTKQDVLTIPGSGTAAMEAAVSNLLCAGDKVVVANVGNFGGRWVKIAKAYGAEVVNLKSPAGQAVDLKLLEETLSEDKDKKIKAVYFQQNETSTGVLNDVEAILKIIHKHGALSIIDAISGLLVADLPMDKWNPDVVVAGSQKAFMIPPGLAFIAMSDRAWKAAETSTMPKFYLDLKWYKDQHQGQQTPTTPALSLFFGLRAAFKLLKTWGLETIFSRQQKLMKATRAGIKALGLDLLAADEWASPTTTAIVPKGFDAEEFRKMARSKYGVSFSGGQGDLKGKIFRIGHLGYVDYSDIIVAISVVEMCLSAMGQKVELGAGVAAVQKELLK